MIATSYLATLLSFRRPQACGVRRVAGAQTIYGAIFSGSITLPIGVFPSGILRRLQAGEVKTRQIADFTSPLPCPQLGYPGHSALGYQHLCHKQIVSTLP